MADEAVPATLAPQSDPKTERATATTGNSDTGAKEDVTTADGPPAASGDAEPSSDLPKKQSTDETEPTAEPTANASAPEVTAVNGEGSTATPSKKQQKRKSTGGTPSGGKKLQRKKSMPDIHLDVKPGEHWFVRMKGFTPWPAIICDEEMLPLSLLEKRPVSAMRPDGTWREDFREGGKNARDRRYPVLFLGTYEFGWQVNTELMPLDVDDVKDTVEKGDQGKKSKALWSAYQVAAEGHDLQWFKSLLEDHESQRKAAEEASIAAEEARIAAEEEKKTKKEKKQKAKTDKDGDVEMEGAENEDGEKKKATKKRKKEEGETDTPKPKTKIVLKGLKSAADEGEEPKPKKAKKSKPSSDGSEEEKAKPVEPPLSEEEIKMRKEKHVLFLRHKLQKGLVSREVPPKSDDMPTMDEHLTALENFRDLELQIIRETKVAKLLKLILKLTELPRDDEFKFKDRCSKLLAGWNAIINADEAQRGTESGLNGVANGAKPEASSEKPSVEEKEPVANGNSKPDKATEKSIETESAALIEKAEKEEPTPVPPVA